jgi:hypothetical protein
MIAEHDRIVLTGDVPQEDLRAGAVGTVVFVHGGGEAYEVEFLSPGGGTAAVATVLAEQARPVSPSDTPHARPLAAVA